MAESGKLLNMTNSSKCTTAEHLENPDLSSNVNVTEQQVDYIS